MRPWRVRVYPRWVSGDLNLREVGPNLYVGSMHAPLQFRGLVGERPRLVVDMNGSYSPFPERYIDADKVISLPMRDGEPIPARYLDEALPLILKARRRGPVLVHCAMGFSRSASVAYAALRLQDEFADDTALACVKAHPDYPMPVTLASARGYVDGQS